MCMFAKGCGGWVQTYSAKKGGPATWSEPGCLHMAPISPKYPDLSASWEHPVVWKGGASAAKHCSSLVLWLSLWVCLCCMQSSCRIQWSANCVCFCICLLWNEKWQWQIFIFIRIYLMHRQYTSTFKLVVFQLIKEDANVCIISLCFIDHFGYFWLCGHICTTWIYGKPYIIVKVLRFPSNYLKTLLIF